MRKGAEGERLAATCCSWLVLEATTLLYMGGHLCWSGCEERKISMNYSRSWGDESGGGGYVCFSLFYKWPDDGYVRFKCRTSI